MEEEFKLPDRWYIAVPNEEDCEIYWDYFNTGEGKIHVKDIKNIIRFC